MPYDSNFDKLADYYAEEGAFDEADYRLSAYWILRNSGLDDRKLYILWRNFLDGETLKRIASELRISPSRVRQINLNSLRDIRRKLCNDRHRADSAHDCRPGM